MSSYSIIGCYGEGNLGDEAILAGLKHLIKTFDENATFTIYISSENFYTDYEVRTVLDLSIIKYKHWYGLFCKGKLFDILNAMHHSNVIVIGGGELIRDDFGLLPLLSLFEKALIAKLFRNKLFLFGIGVGRIDTKIGRILAQILVLWADAVVVRDNESKKLLQALVPSRKINATSDVAFTLPPANTGAYVNKPLIAVSLRDWPSAWSSKTINKDKQILLYNKFLNQLAAALKTLQDSYQYKFLFIPFRIENGDDDRKAIRDIISRANLTNYSISDYCSDPYKVKKMISKCSMMIGMRLHACILALSEGVPTLSINYDHKNTKLMSDFGMDNFVLDIYDADYYVYLNKLIKCSEISRDAILSKLDKQNISIYETYSACLVKSK